MASKPAVSLATATRLEPAELAELHKSNDAITTAKEQLFEAQVSAQRADMAHDKLMQRLAVKYGIGEKGGINVHGEIVRDIPSAAPGPKRA